MTKREIKKFIEEMEAYGEFWTEEEVENVYGAYSLDMALDMQKDGLDSERLSLSDARDIWLSHGKDEDYMFGYTEEELENE